MCDYIMDVFYLLSVEARIFWGTHGDGFSFLCDYSNDSFKTPFKKTTKARMHWQHIDPVWLNRVLKWQKVLVLFINLTTWSLFLCDFDRHFNFSTGSTSINVRFVLTKHLRCDFLTIAAFITRLP